MAETPEINSKIRAKARCLKGAGACAALRLPLLWITIVSIVWFASCSPRMLEDGGRTLNPIEVLERSPRVYEITFKAFADSIETARASSYLSGDLGADAFPSLRVLSALQDSARAAGLSARETAELEFFKARRRFEAGAEQAAAYHLKRAMAADPSYRPPYVLLGGMLLERRAIEQAFDLFSKMLSWDATDSDALVGLARCYMRMGRLDDARKTLVDAVIFNRANLKAWGDLEAVAELQGASIANHDAPELGLARKVTGRRYKILVDDSLQDCPVEATAWIAYASERAVWRFEDKFKMRFGVTKYVPTYEEDVDCYMVLAAVWQTLTQEGAAQDSVPCSPAYLDYLGRVAEDGYLVSHVLFDHVSIEAPAVAKHFSVEVIARLREYVNTYVIVPKS